MHNRTSLPAVLGRLLVQFEKLTSLKTLDGNRTNVVDSNELHIDDKLLNNIAVNTSSMSLQCVGGSADDPWNNAFFLGTILVSMTLISNLIIHHSMLNLILMGTKKRIACCSLIYRKVTSDWHECTTHYHSIYQSSGFSEYSFISVGCVSNRHRPHSKFDIKWCCTHWKMHALNSLYLDVSNTVCDHWISHLAAGWTSWRHWSCIFVLANSSTSNLFSRSLQIVA